MSDCFEDSSTSLQSTYSDVWRSIGITFQGDLAFVPCHPLSSTRPPLVPKEESLHLFIEDIMPAYALVTTLPQSNMRDFREKVRIAWFGIWPIQGDDVLVILEKEDLEIQKMLGMLRDGLTERHAHDREHENSADWRSLFHDCLRRSRYADWVHYITLSPGPILIELNLTNLEDWFEIATIALSYPTQPLWCKGYSVWKSASIVSSDDEGSESESSQDLTETEGSGSDTEVDE